MLARVCGSQTVSSHLRWNTVDLISVPARIVLTLDCRAQEGVNVHEYVIELEIHFVSLVFSPRVLEDLVIID